MAVASFWVKCSFNDAREGMALAPQLAIHHSSYECLNFNFNEYISTDSNGKTLPKNNLFAADETKKFFLSLSQS